MSSNKQAILKMGTMLLEGWRMLSEGCPLCATALMSKGGNMRCPQCDLPVVLESNMDATQQVFTENPLSSGTGATGTASESKSEENSSASASPRSSFQSLEEAKKEYDRKNRKQQDTVSGLIGQYMLKGWTLLGAQCPKCEATPLMRQGKGPRYCVSCKEQVHEEEEDDSQEKSSPRKDDTKLSERFDMDKIPMLDPDMSGKPMKEPTEQSLSIAKQDKLEKSVTLNKSDTDFVDKWSHQISTKLMCGWKLLDEVCERAAGGCYGDLPLVQDLSGEKYCVKCGYQNKPPILCVEASDESDDELEDEELDDELAIRIQKMTNKTFTDNFGRESEKGSCDDEEEENDEVFEDNVDEVEDEVVVPPSSPPVVADLKQFVTSHIDKKLKTTACCLTSASLSATEATEWARLITALAEARKAVKNM